MLRQKAAVAATGIEAKRCNSLLKMEQIVSAAAVKQKFVRVFCVPTQITANHAPSIREPTRGRRQLHTRRSNCTRGLPARRRRRRCQPNQMGGGRGAGKARHAPVCVRLCGQNRITVVLRGPTASGFCVLWHWSLWMTHTQAFSSHG